MQQKVTLQLIALHTHTDHKKEQTRKWVLDGVTDVSFMVLEAAETKFDHNPQFHLN